MTSVEPEQHLRHKDEGRQHQPLPEVCGVHHSQDVVGPVQLVTPVEQLGRTVHTVNTGRYLVMVNKAVKIDRLQTKLVLTFIG